jgi:hypothetical protein
MESHALRMFNWTCYRDRDIGLSKEKETREGPNYSPREKIIIVLGLFRIGSTSTACHEAKNRWYGTVVANAAMMAHFGTFDP